MSILSVEVWASVSVCGIRQMGELLLKFNASSDRRVDRFAVKVKGRVGECIYARSAGLLIQH